MARLARSLLEALLLLIGGALLAFWSAALLHQHLLSAADRAVFEEAEPQAMPPPPPPPNVREAGRGREPWVEPPANTRLWSAKRLAAYLESTNVFGGTRLALLEIPAIDLSVVVLDGTSEWTLNRGVGRIEGTATPGGIGNVGIAGHRDGFFRGLMNVRTGDVIRLTLPGKHASSAYRIEWIQIVDPADVWVLEPTEQPSLTLVTCHPFHFVGHAPERYVVRAVACPECTTKERPWSTASSHEPMPRWPRIPGSGDVHSAAIAGATPSSLQ